MDSKASEAHVQARLQSKQCTAAVSNIITTGVVLQRSSQISH
jgi:hypothetical protein